MRPPVPREVHQVVPTFGDRGEHVYPRFGGKLLHLVLLVLQSGYVDGGSPVKTMDKALPEVFPVEGVVNHFGVVSVDERWAGDYQILLVRDFDCLSGLHIVHEDRIVSLSGMTLSEVMNVFNIPLPFTEVTLGLLLFDFGHVSPVIPVPTLIGAPEDRVL